jgi:hypothetical protein
MSGTQNISLSISYASLSIISSLSISSAFSIYSSTLSSSYISSAISIAASSGSDLSDSYSSLYFHTPFSPSPYSSSHWYFKSSGSLKGI